MSIVVCCLRLAVCAPGSGALIGDSCLKLLELANVQDCSTCAYSALDATRCERPTIVDCKRGAG